MPAWVDIRLVGVDLLPAARALSEGLVGNHPCQIDYSPPSSAAPGIEIELSIVRTNAATVRTILASAGVTVLAVRERNA